MPPLIQSHGAAAAITPRLEETSNLITLPFTSLLKRYDPNSEEKPGRVMDMGRTLAYFIGACTGILIIYLTWKWRGRMVKKFRVGWENRRGQQQDADRNGQRNGDTQSGGLNAPFGYISPLRTDEDIAMQQRVRQAILGRVGTVWERADGHGPDGTYEEIELRDGDLGAAPPSYTSRERPPKYDPTWAEAFRNGGNSQGRPDED
ncbi:hypothetical protein ABW19_dt0206347 [Dactylella cylindrospora]|nr:hypothetical protein ABW19_dt0206347 [Dactylella cylindrospora]